MATSVDKEDVQLQALATIKMADGGFNFRGWQ